MNIFKKIFGWIPKTIKFFSENFKWVLFILILFLVFGTSNQETKKPHNLEHIKFIGPIIDVSQTLQKIEKATKDNNIKGVLIEFNSPGGAVAPSIELELAIKRLKEKKPVVVYSSGLLASGSYYASIWADKIVANPGSIVGSIGVIFEGANLKELMDKIGIKTQVVKMGKYKQIGTPDREWLPYEKKELQKIIKDTYDMFVSDVAKARKLDKTKKEIWADAHVFTARQAKKVGLIDKVGSIYDAKEELIKLSGVVNPVWNKESEIDKILKKLSSKTSMILYNYFPSATLK